MFVYICEHVVDVASIRPRVKLICDPGVGTPVVGAWVGNLVGFSVGDRDGIFDGFSVGDCVGFFVGDTEGDTVGFTVGDSEGLEVGDTVGDTVGA